MSDASADHILLEDVNLHHPSWGGPRVTSIVLPSCFCPSKSYTTSLYYYPQRLSLSKGTVERVL
jgi:hypothetical protein